MKKGDKKSFPTNYKLFNSKFPNKNKAVLYHYSSNRPKKSQNARTKNNQIIHLNELGYRNLK